MEMFFVKLAVAVIPLIILVASVNSITAISKWYAYRPLAWHRSRHHFLRALAAGFMLR